MPMSTNALQNNQGGNPDFDFDNGKGRHGYTRWCKARREEKNPVKTGQRRPAMATDNKTVIADTYWKCSNCGNTVQMQAPPQTCPACSQKCPFLNVTCYQPECGFTGIDPRLK